MLTKNLQPLSTEELIYINGGGNEVAPADSSGGGGGGGGGGSYATLFGGVWTGTATAATMWSVGAIAGGVLSGGALIFIGVGVGTGYGYIFNYLAQPPNP